MAVTQNDAMSGEWETAIRNMVPAQVAFLLLECTKADAPRTVHLQVGLEADARTFSVPAARLVPALEADIERRMDKSSRQVGRGT